MCYQERLQVLNLTTLETRRRSIRVDLIEVFKIFKAFEDIDAELLLHGHELKVVKPRARLDVRKYFFGDRVVDEWNRLPEEIIQCHTCLLYTSDAADE